MDSPMPANIPPNGESGTHSLYTYIFLLFSVDTLFGPLTPSLIFSASMPLAHKCDKYTRGWPSKVSFHRQSIFLMYRKTGLVFESCLFSRNCQLNFVFMASNHQVVSDTRTKETIHAGRKAHAGRMAQDISIHAQGDLPDDALKDASLSAWRQ